MQQLQHWIKQREAHLRELQSHWHARCPCGLSTIAMKQPEGQLELLPCTPTRKRSWSGRAALQTAPSAASSAAGCGCESTPAEPAMGWVEQQTRRVHGSLPAGGLQWQATTQVPTLAKTADVTELLPSDIA